MRKKILSFLSGGIISLFLVTVAYGSLYGFWKTVEQDFIPCNQERAELAAEFAVWDYDCSIEKNNILEDRLRDYYKLDEAGNPVLGYSVVTRYKTTLGSSMTSSQATIPVSSITTFDGTTLTMSLLGDKVFLTLEPGGNKEEIIKCTGISGTNFTGCIRGLAFSGTTETAVAANRKAHNAGSVVVMSNVHYVYDQLVDKSSDDTIKADLTVTGTIFYYDENFGIRSNGTNLQWSEDAFVNSYNFTSSALTVLTASSTKGMGVTDSKIHINSSSTGGLEFDATTGYLQVDAGAGIKTDSTGTQVDEANIFAWTGANTHAGQESFADTITFTTTTMDRATITSSTITNLDVSELCFGGTDCGADMDALLEYATTTEVGWFATSTNLGSDSNGTYDEVITTGFRPKVIEFDYFVQGLESSGVLEQKIIGNIRYLNTTKEGGSYTTCDSTTNGSCGIPTGVFLDQTPTLAAGTGAGNVTTISLQSISDTGWTFRYVWSGNDATDRSNTNIARISWKAFR